MLVFQIHMPYSTKPGIIPWVLKIGSSLEMIAVSIQRIIHCYSQAVHLENSHAMMDHAFHLIKDATRGPIINFLMADMLRHALLRVWYLNLEERICICCSSHLGYAPMS